MSVAAVWFVRVLLVLLGLFSLLLEIIIVPLIGQEVVSTFPETEPLFLPTLVWSILVIGCGQAILVIVWQLVSLVAQEKVFSAAALPRVRAIIALSVGAFVLLIAAFVVANVLGFTPPVVMYGLIGLSLVCLTFALVMRTMLGLLRRATQLHDEMAEVV
jgi:hypothetical protein